MDIVRITLALLLPPVGIGLRFCLKILLTAFFFCRALFMLSRFL